MSHVQAKLAAPRSAPFLCARRRFFSLCTRLLRQITGGACLYMLQDSHWLASFEVIPPPSYFCRGQKNENFLGTMRTHFDFWKKSQTYNRFFSSFLAVFVWSFVTPISTFVNDKRSCSDSANSQAKKLRFFCAFFRRWVWQDFVTPISTFANIDGSLPTNSTTLNRLR